MKVKNIILIIILIATTLTSCSNKFIYKQAMKRGFIKDSIYVVKFDTIVVIDTVFQTKEIIYNLDSDGDSLIYSDSLIDLHVKYDSVLRRLKATLKKKAQNIYIKVPVRIYIEKRIPVLVPKPIIVQKEGFFYKSGQAFWLVILLFLITYFGYKWIKNIYLR